MSPSSRPRARTTPTNSYPSGQLRLVHPTLQFGTISSVSSFPYAYRGTPCQLAFSMAFTLIRVASFMLINIRYGSNIMISRALISVLLVD
jgi:hypothetical protein